MISSEMIEALQKCEIFNLVQEEDLTQIAKLCAVETYDVGENVITQGEFSIKIYLIAEGQVALLRDVNLGGRQGVMTVDLLGKGRSMGWSSLFCEPCSMSASAVCQKPTKIVSLDGGALRAMLENNPELGFIVMDRLAHVLGHRLRAVYGAIDTFR